MFWEKAVAAVNVPKIAEDHLAAAEEKRQGNTSSGTKNQPDVTEPADKPVDRPYGKANKGYVDTRENGKKTSRSPTSESDSPRAAAARTATVPSGTTKASADALASS